MALKKEKSQKCEKRKKRSSVIIDNKTYYFYKIIWEDIVGDSSISSADEFSKMKTALIISFAYVFKKENGYLYTFSSYSDDGFFGDRNIIPIGCIKSIHKH